MNSRELMKKLDEMPIAKFGSTMDIVGRVHFEALDNAAHTEGVKVYNEFGRHTDDYYAAWHSSLETILACCDFVTDECCEWYRAEGVRF